MKKDNRAEIRRYEMISCPICGGETLHLGMLGYLDYYRCRDCGVTGYSFKAEPTLLQKRLQRRQQRKVQVEKVCNAMEVR